MGYPYPPGGYLPDPFTSPISNLISSGTPNVPQQFSIPSNFINLSPNVSCVSNTYGTYACTGSSTGQITLNKTQNQIQLTFNLESDYLHYKNALIDEYDALDTNQQNIPLTGPIPCPAGSTDTSYYRYFEIGIPIQGPNANCGDNTTTSYYRFHFNDYFNIQYVESPSTNAWSITIPQTLMVNCYPQVSCDSCYNNINDFIGGYNSQVNNFSPFTFTTNVGAKYANPIRRTLLNRYSSGGVSGSYCFDSPVYGQSYPWYGTHTVPFISSSTGWVNLYSLQATLPCITSSFPIPKPGASSGIRYEGAMYGYQVRFPHLTSSFNYSLSTNDFEIYALQNTTNTGSLNHTQGVSPLPCTDPSGSLIYSYIGGVATMYTSSYFFQGNTPTLIIDP
jgi:hypothetical protein